MRTRYKLLIVIAAVLVAALVLTACNFGGGGDPPVDEIPGNGNGNGGEIDPGNGNGTNPVADFTAVFGQSLYEFTLPAGWTWLNPTDPVGSVGLRPSFAVHLTSGDTRTFIIDVRPAVPDYTLPTGLTATFGNTLANVSLPPLSGWTWVEPPTTSVGNAGIQGHYARFTPFDTFNFQTVTRRVNIDVARLQVAMPTLNNSVLLHNGLTHTVEISAPSPWVVTTGGTFSAVNVGRYTVNVALVDTNNTEWATGGTGVFTIDWNIIRVPQEVVYASRSHSMALDAGGNVWTWGNNLDGQLGHNNTTTMYVPTKITYEVFFNETIIAVSAGELYSMALDSNGDVWTWGNGSGGRLGHNNTTRRNVPTRITNVAFSNSHIIAISAGVAHSMALDNNGNVWTWGWGEHGQLGHGGTSNRLVPTMITPTAFSDVRIIAISAGRSHSMVLDSNGDVWIWGSGDNGQLGHGDTEDRLVPTRIKHSDFASVNIIAISAGEIYSMALDAGGNVWTWGNGGWRSLGHGDTENRLVPTRITHTAISNANIIAISASWRHSIALDAQGNVWTWGYGQWGSLGHGDTGDRLVPTRITHTVFYNATITAISAGGDHSIALDSNGNVWTWGHGSSRLGHGDTIQRNVPTLITHVTFNATATATMFTGNKPAVAFAKYGDILCNTSR